MEDKNTLNKTDIFLAWLNELKDKTAQRRIRARIHLAENGDFGDCRSVGDGVSEMRIHYGPGYRLYFCQTGADRFLLLCGGTKGAQQRDIERAKTIKGEIGEAQW